MQVNTDSTSATGDGLSSPNSVAPRPRRLARRSFIRNLGIGAALVGPGVAFLSASRAARAATGSLTSGDVAILRFLAAAELIETDLWQQYTELATGNPAFSAALAVLDEDMAQYVSDNTDDEKSHAAFINQYLISVGEAPVNLSAFRTLPSSHATGAQQIGRLTNLMNLTVDTSWWLRYRSHKNPDFGETFPQFIKIVNFPAIPNIDLQVGSKRAQAIANTAAFHFATIEQGGSSLYASFVPKASSFDLLQILPAIGGTEVFHFAIWHDKAGNAPAVSVPGVSFPDIASFDGNSTRQKNLIMPEPCQFLQPGIHPCSVIRPTSTPQAGAVAAATALTNSGLFQGQSQEFFAAVSSLATAADAATRVC